MKKKLVTVKDFAAMQEKIRNAKKHIKNELTEDAAELRRSLLDMLDELENAEVEVDETLALEVLRQVPVDTLAASRPRRRRQAPGPHRRA